VHGAKDCIAVINNITQKMVASCDANLLLDDGLFFLIIRAIVLYFVGCLIRRCGRFHPLV